LTLKPSPILNRYTLPDFRGVTIHFFQLLRLPPPHGMTVSTMLSSSAAPEEVDGWVCPRSVVWATPVLVLQS
jgi:hypothetical protein